MPRLGRGDQDLGPDEEEYYNPGRRRGVGCFFADDPTIAVTPVAAATTTTTAVRRRPFFGRTSTTRRRDDVGRKGGASVGGGQSAACARDGWCSAPRTAALLRTVQRGDYGTLTKLLSRSNSGRDEQAWTADTGVLGALLIEASGREHLDCMELLIQSMACKPKRKLKRQGYYPMHTAAGAGTLESMELLISAGLSPKTKDQGGCTPLHHASAHGSAECVSFLCVTAGSTLLSRDKGAGDTPLHFAVRAGHSICAEVLLSHAREDLLHETNAEGETPLDVAKTVGDETLWRALQDGDRRRHHALTNESYLYSRYRSDERATRSEVGRAVDVGRIMAVWERFFENAALVAVGSGLAGVSDGNTDDPEGRQYGPRGAMRRRERKRNKGVCELNDNGETVETVGTHRELVVARKGWAYGGGDSGSKCGSECLADGQRHSQTQNIQGPEMPGALATPRTQFCAWDVVTDDNALGHNKFYPFPVDELTLQRAGESWTQFAGDANNTPCSDDADLFQTPNGGSGDWVWPTDDRLGETQPSFELLANSEAISTDEVTLGCVPPLQGWITCWDAASESVYYWDPESQSSTWDVTTILTGAKVSSEVWDPRQKAFFTVDASGASRWLSQSAPTSLGAWSDELWKDTDTANVSVAVDTGDHHGSARSYGSVPRPSQELGMLRSPSSEDNDSFYAALSEEEVYGSGELRPDEGDEDRLEFSAVKKSQPNARQLVENQGRYNNVGSVLYAQERSSYHVSTSQAGGAEDGGQSDGVTDCAVHSVGDRSSPESVAPTPNMGVQENVDGVEFFDPNSGEEHEKNDLEDTIGDTKPEVQAEEECASDRIDADSTLARLPKWLMWCSQPRDAIPYFVNEETGASSWVLPPEAVMFSGGWLRAWSEEHQAKFYVNHWTGRVTWESGEMEVDSD